MIKLQQMKGLEIYESDLIVEKLINEYDDTAMPLPDIEAEPHLLISKVRKHYMEYIIKLLTVNYENNQKLPNKNIYLPSAIWRCAKLIEMTAAQTCMMVQIYRKNIVAVIKELKNDTNKGKLNKKLYECLRKPPENEKKSQASFSSNDCSCQCSCNLRKKRRKVSDSPKIHHNGPDLIHPIKSKVKVDSQPIFNIPVIENLHVDSPQMAVQKSYNDGGVPYTSLAPIDKNKNEQTVSSLNTTTRLSIETHDSDELMLQLEKLFQGETQEDDIFEGGFCDNIDSSMQDDALKKNVTNMQPQALIQDSVLQNHSDQIKSLDERLASLAGLLVNNNDSNNTPQEKADTTKNKKRNSSKWLCEEYFLKTKLYELLDEIGDSNRKKLARVKEMLTNLFGDDSDDEGIMSPLEETPEFMISCKERIAPWVVKLLTPYYIKGRIKGKVLFKAVAKHLIKLIYQCSRYPQEYEVKSFVADFLENHKIIRCEADFMQFKIDNL